MSLIIVWNASLQACQTEPVWMFKVLKVDPNVYFCVNVIKTCSECCVWGKQQGPEPLVQKELTQPLVQKELTQPLVQKELSSNQCGGLSLFRTAVRVNHVPTIDLPVLSQKP